MGGHGNVLRFSRQMEKGSVMASFGAIVPVRWITTIGVKTDPVAWSVAFARQAAKVSNTSSSAIPRSRCSSSRARSEVGA